MATKTYCDNFNCEKEMKETDFMISIFTSFTPDVEDLHPLDGKIFCSENCLMEFMEKKDTKDL